ncbi:MAG TPA: hypothetical protein VG013_30225 [Gemmataceae bacterium]|jgi:hypothetical protein|nr:hypothetical protein [Gemmataceae bacterium]
MSRPFAHACLLCCAFCLLPSARAAKVKVWNHHTPSHYDKAHFEHAVISSEGTLRLSRRLKPLAQVDATHVWDVVEDRDGNLYVATGDEGKLYKVSPGGKVSVAFDSQDSEILCLAVAPDGAIYAGTGPGGLIIRVAPNGTARVLYHSPEAYVWSLAVDPKTKKLYAGTGPRGRIYQVTPAGKASVFYTSKQEHILSLATGPDGLLYAGTDKHGLVYRIDARGKGFVLYSAPQGEVRKLVVTPDGVYAGTSSPSRRHGGSAGSSGSYGSVHLSASAASATTTPDRATAVPASSRGGRSSTSKADDRAGPAPAPSSPGFGDNSVYRIAPDGTVREVFREKALVLSLLRHNGHIFIGTGMEGQLYEVDEASKEHSELARLDHGQIHCLYRRHDGSIVVGTGDPGKLYVLEDRYAESGTVVSDVLDAKIISKWGAVRWKADTPRDTGVSVAVRSGNLADPDETWSDWSDELTDGRHATVAAPTARFLQYRVTLTTQDPEATPALHSLAVRYMTTNQAPEVTAVDVPDIDAVDFDHPKKLRFKWTATDPNEDDLTYSLYVRKEGWKNWVQLEDSLEKKEYEWDTTTTPSGVYRLKVVASDQKDNPAEDALSGERVSGPFAVAHTPPVVTVKVVGMDGEQAVVEASAADPLVRLTSAAFAVNGKKWTGVFPTDGLFDSKTESFRFKTKALKSGTYVLVLRVGDAAGNTGSGDVVFTVRTQAAQR